MLYIVNKYINIWKIKKKLRYKHQILKYLCLQAKFKMYKNGGKPKLPPKLTRY